MPPISSPPPARPGPPWIKGCERRPVTRRFFRAGAVHNENSAVVGRQPQDDFGGQRIVCAEYGSRQTAAAALGERNRLRRVAVGQHGRDRTEGFHRVNRFRRPRVAAQQ